MLANVSTLGMLASVSTSHPDKMAVVVEFNPPTYLKHLRLNHPGLTLAIIRNSSQHMHNAGMHAQASAHECMAVGHIDVQSTLWVEPAQTTWAYKLLLWEKGWQMCAIQCEMAFLFLWSHPLTLHLT